MRLRLQHATAVVLSAGAICFGYACSLQNQDGPDVTCEDLECGRVNACVEGIIAQCVDGRHLKYHVCASTDICQAEWQKKGEYRCSFEHTDCEGCRPERAGCGDLGGGDQGGGGGGGGEGGGF